jgi:sterol desaturase/sphingolipid hydroxylase (fatty acid hydroxylase superfamily)
MDPFVVRVLRVLGKPFSSWDSFVAGATDWVWTLTNLHSRTAWLYLISSLAVAYCVYRYGKRYGQFSRDKSFREVVFPADVYGHRSAIVDYKFVAFDRIIRAFVYVPFFSGVTYYSYIALEKALGRSSLQVPEAIALWLLPVLALVVGDFGLFLGHWLMHRLPFLWPFHEVHHSAEVLTPFTLARVHPVEEFFLNWVNSVLYAVAAAFFTSLTAIELHPLSIAGLNVVTFFFYIFGFQLRHSHVWLSYGPLWSRIFISPAQHQVHHSEADKHWNTNFGYMFAFWDLIFGTLYVPKQPERIVFGCGVDPSEYSTVSRLYLRPFAKSYAVVAAGVRRRLTRRLGRPDEHRPAPEASQIQPS